MFLNYFPSFCYGVLSAVSDRFPQKTAGPNINLLIKEQKHICLKNFMQTLVT